MRRAPEFKLAILDRDGTINRDSPNYIKSADEWRALPGSLEAIARLNHAGWTVTVATNQSGLGRGLFTISDLHAMNARMATELAAHGGELSGVFFCPHTPDDDCDCRKPREGLLRSIAERFDCDLRGVPVIGDSQRDLQAALAVGARPILVCTGNGLAMADYYRSRNIEVYADLAAAVEALLADE